MSAQLSQVSAKFVELKQRALAAMPAAQPSYVPQAAAPVAPPQPRSTSPGLALPSINTPRGLTFAVRPRGFSIGCLRG
jgi:hypothetical protein